ncbi:MAG: IS110 family transposase [Candidatus Uhrbacteria bacterium]
MKNITLIGIDLSKNVFEVRCENHTGRLVSRQTLSRNKLLPFIRELPSGSTIAMEACGGSHYWCREFIAIGFNALMMSPQFVAPYRKSQKNDVNDAEAICEASRRPNMRFVPLKTIEQLDLQMLHRIRERLMKQRTALMNQMRGLLIERGIAIPQGVASFRKAIVRIIQELGEQSILAFSVKQLWEEFHHLNEHVNEFSKKIEYEAKTNESCKLLDKLEGVGAMGCTALVAAIGNTKGFENGRSFSASLGMVPRQFSTGGKTVLGGITKVGDGYVRKILIHGARSVVRAAIQKNKTDPLSLWIRELHARCGMNRTAVALANKTARRAWAILAGKQPFAPPQRSERRAA